MRKLEIVPPSPEIVIVVDDEPLIRIGLAGSLERPGRAIVACADIESAELMIETMAVSVVIADVRLTGAFAFEGLDFVRRMKSIHPDVRTILMSGDASDAMEREALARGALALLRKPFDTSDVEVLIGGQPATAGAAAETIEIPQLEEILAGGSIYPVFLPIFRSDGERVELFGFEALSRYSSETPLRNPEVLFRYADRKSRLYELEMQCMGRAVADGVALVPHGLLFINVHPHTLCAGNVFSRAFLDILDRHGVPAGRVVLEITEQAAIDDLASAMAALRELRSRGVRFAFDDVGIAYSHLMHIDQIEPSFLKISQHFGSSFENDESRTKIVRNIFSLASDFGCEVILEGVETDETVAAAGAIGISLLQGYAFGVPARSSELVRNVMPKYGIAVAE